MFNSILVTPRFGGQYSFYAYYVFRKEIKYPIILPNEVFFYIEIRSLWNNYTVMTLEQFYNKQKKYLTTMIFQKKRINIFLLFDYDNCKKNPM